MASTARRFDPPYGAYATRWLRPQRLLDPGLPIFAFFHANDDLDRRTICTGRAVAPDWHWPFCLEDWNTLRLGDEEQVKESYDKFRLFYELGQKYVQLVNSRCEELFDSEQTYIDEVHDSIPPDPIRHGPDTQLLSIITVRRDDADPDCVMERSMSYGESISTGIPMCSQAEANAYDRKLREHFKAVDAQYQCLMQDDIDLSSPEAYIDPDKVKDYLQGSDRSIDRYYDAKIAQVKAYYKIWFEARRDAKSTWQDISVRCKFKCHISESPFVPFRKP